MRPGPRLFQIAGVWLAASFAPLFWPDATTAWLGLGIGLLMICLVDARAVARTPAPEAVRRVPAALSLRVQGEVELRLTNATDRDLDASVFDHYPPGDQIENLPQRVTLPAGGWTELTYTLVPSERGDRRFELTDVLVDSPFRIWRRLLHCGEPTTVRVYPNFASVSKYALLATHNRVSPTGVRRRRRRGEGLEFHQLRDYRPGDSLRQIDWKASSRTARLISREYQEERDQQVCFLIDCGHRMRSHDDLLSHFDHSLNAIMLLAHIALRQGDGIGMMTFGGPQRYLPPQKGTVALNVLLDAIYDLQPRMTTPDYAEAATNLMRRLRRRSLVVIVTNLRDDDREEILPALRLLRRRHLVLLASLREQVMTAALADPVADFDGALRVAATHRYLLGRRKLHDAIQEHGVLSLDVEPSRLPANMVNRYLEIKGSGRL